MERLLYTILKHSNNVINIIILYYTEHNNIILYYMQIAVLSQQT